MNDSCLGNAVPVKSRWIIILAAFFAVASVLDWTLTRWLLMRDVDAYEANPLAAFVLNQFGWSGLGFFKAIGVAVVVAIGIYVARSRPIVARRLLMSACCVICVVLGYSTFLIIQSHTVETDPVKIANNDPRTVKLAQCLEEGKRYSFVLDRLSEQLKYGQINLRDAVETLKGETETYRYFRIGVVLETYFDVVGDFETRLASHLIHRTGFNTKHESQQLRDDLFRTLANQFREFHPNLPKMAQEAFDSEIPTQL